MRSTPPGQPVIDCTVELLDMSPKVWRRLLVPGSIRLDKLHRVLQAAMGWEDSHLHAWTIGDERYGMQFDDYPDGELDEAAYTVVGTVGRVGQLLYEYDFGDSWDHVVDVNAVTRHGRGLSKAVCLDGGGACPLEDCGGTGGYSDLIRVLDDPTDPQHAHMLSWAGGPVDPTAFDVVNANIRLQKVR